MAKIIKMTQQVIEETRRDFEEALRGAKLSDGKINFTKSFGVINRKAKLLFTEIAWLKMQTLIREFDKEVAWHGIAKRSDDLNADEYIVSDILVYPQEVTGSEVKTDQAKYQMWLMEHDDDVFNNIRMQGHSHVNMGTTPSGVDSSLYERILEQLDDDMFYIFLIYNKLGEKTIKIYDIAKNVLFETSDVTVEIMDDDTGVEKFVKKAKEMVQDKKYTPPATGYYNGYNSTGGYSSGYSQNYTTPSSPASQSASPVIYHKENNHGKKKGKRKSKDSNNYQAGNANGDKKYQSSIFDNGYDDEDNEYSAWKDRFYPYRNCTDD